MTEIVPRHDAVEVRHPALESTVDESAQARNIVRPISTNCTNAASVSEPRTVGNLLLTSILLLPIRSEQKRVKVDHIELRESLAGASSAELVQVVGKLVHRRREYQDAASWELGGDDNLGERAASVPMDSGSDAGDWLDHRVETAQRGGSVASFAGEDLDGSASDKLDESAVQSNWCNWEDRALASSDL